MREPGRPPPPYSKLDKPVRFPSTQLEDSSAPPDPPIPRIIYTTTEPARGRRGRLASARFRLACSASARFWRDRRRVSGLQCQLFWGGRHAMMAPEPQRIQLTSLLARQHGPKFNAAPV
jgi:hypothetical protein